MTQILVVHNAYQQRGGEDTVVEAEIALLRARGHTVAEYRRSNDDLNGMGRAQAALQTFWSTRTEREVSALIAAQRIDVLHVHNTFPLISPSVYHAAAKAGVPVVQTLHNFRLVCPQGLMLRDDVPCESCVGRVPWPGVVHACYRGSRSQTAVLAAMVTLHRGLRTWRDKVTRYIALNEFCRQKFIEGGLPAARIVVKPNFVDAGPAPAADAPRHGALYVGRLSREKGIAVLADAMKRLAGRVALTVVGTGPEAGLLDGLPGVTMLGAQPAERVMALMRAARLLVMPSIWYENFPRTLVEAYGCALPVLASRLGAMAHLVRDGHDGVLFEAGSGAALADALQRLEADPARCAALGRAARRTYEDTLTPEANYAQLVRIYDDARAALGRAAA